MDSHLKCKLVKCTNQKTQTLQTEVRGWEKVFLANETNKKAGIAILISDKIDLKTVIRDNEDTT